MDPDSDGFDEEWFFSRAEYHEPRPMDPAGETSESLDDLLGEARQIPEITASAFQELTEGVNLRCPSPLFHLTRTENLVSIRRRGLMSPKRARVQPGSTVPPDDRHLELPDGRSLNEFVSFSTRLDEGFCGKRLNEMRGGDRLSWVALRTNVDALVADGREVWALTGNPVLDARATTAVAGSHRVGRIACAASVAAKGRSLAQAEILSSDFVRWQCFDAIVVFDSAGQEQALSVADDPDLVRRRFA